MQIIITNILSKYKNLSHPTSIRSNQELLKCGTVMKLGWTPTVNGTRLCVLTSYLKEKECVRWKLESAHHSGIPYFYSQELVGNSSLLPSLFTNPRINSNISIPKSHRNGQSITHRLSTLIETVGLRPLPNYPTYAAHPLSKIGYSYFLDMIVTLTTSI